MKRTYIVFRCCILVVVLVCKSPLSFSQDISSDLQRMKSTYDGFSSISYEADYISYMNNLSTPSVDVAHGSLVQQGNDKYQKIGNIEIISNDQYTLTADHDAHSLYYSANSINTPQQTVTMDVPQLLEFCTIKKIEKVNDSYNAFTLVPKKKSDDFERVRIVYETKTYLVKEMQLHYAKSTTYVVKGKAMQGKPILVVAFKNYKINPKINQQLFTYDKFIRKEKEQLLVKPAYKNYSINGAGVLSLKNN